MTDHLGRSVCSLCGQPEIDHTGDPTVECCGVFTPIADRGDDRPVRILISRSEHGDKLYDLMVLKTWEPDEVLHGITAAQVSGICSEHGVHLDQVYAVPHV